MKNYFKFILLVPLLIVTGCTRNDDQRAFEEQAYMQASEFTRTNNQGDVVDVDEDDWRISPLHQGLVTDIHPPFPNPANTSIPINFEVYVRPDAVSGLELVVRYPDGQINTIYFTTESPLPTLTTFQIDASELGSCGTIECARGLHRVFLFDGNQQMISYGDIMVE